MTTFPNYTTGTVAVPAGATTIAGTGCNWSGLNAQPGDDIVIAGNTVVIQDVINATTLAIDAWPYSAVAAGASYKIIQRSPNRYAGGSAMAAVNNLVQALNTDGFYVFVPSTATVPDPSYGNDGQYAFQAATGKLWQKVSGAWSYLGIYKGFAYRGAYNNATAYGVNEVVTSGGSSYIAIASTTGNAPPNATYWGLLASIGNTGPIGATGASYGGTSTTSLTIGTGAQAFTTQSGLAYQNGARVRASSNGSPSNWMEGVATYSGTTLTISVDRTSGSGTFTDWNLNVVGQPGAGDLSSANNLSDLANKSTSRANLGVPQTYGQCKLVLSGSNLVLKPFNGNLLTIAGTPQTVPDTGVSLAPTGLAAGNVYYIYAYMNSGVMTLEASVTGHVTSTTAGNNGTEIKSGDNTRTLVGMAQPITGPAWTDTISQRYVRTWFNDGGVECLNYFDFASRPTTNSVSPTFVELVGNRRLEVLLWAGERWLLDASGGGWLSAAGAVYFAIGVDGSTPEQGGCFGNSSAAGVTVSLGASTLKTGLAEGYHLATLLGAVSSGTATFISSGVDPLGCSIRGATRR